MHWLPALWIVTTACWHEAKPAPSQPQTKPMTADVQPVTIEKLESTDDANDNDHGEVGGVMGGDPCGAPPPPPPPPPPPAPPTTVPPAVLESSRIAGDKLIAPDDLTKLDIQRAGKDKLVGSFKLCISTSGAVTTTTQLKSTGFPDYDAKIQRTMGGWRYRPFEVNGRAVPVCTAVTFIYSQPLPPPPGKQRP